MPRRSAPPAVTLWPLWALGLLGCHALVLVFLHARPGHIAIVPFLVARPLLLAASGLLVVLAAVDLLYGGWRRLVRLRLVFDLLALAATIVLALFAYRTYPSSHDGRTAAVCLALPLEGEIAVLQGGPTLEGNSHAGSPAQRYAYDLAISELGSTHAGEGALLWDHFAYGRTVHSPVGGTVIAVHDGAPDRPPSSLEWHPWQSAEGNYVVVQVDHDQFVVVSHLQVGSIPVAPNDHVTPGTPLGRVGNSGRAGAPHLHLHAQDTPVVDRGEGIPIAFCEYEAIDFGADWRTARIVTGGMPSGRGRPQVIRRVARDE